MLSKENRLNLSKEFYRLKKRGAVIKDPFYTILWLTQKEKEAPSKLGFVVSNKLGKAAFRNRIRRILREVCREILHLLPRGLNIAVIASPRVASCDREVLKKSLSKSFTSLYNRTTL